MSTIKSFSVGDGDTFYIRHGSDNFTMIDCCLSNADRERIVDELERESQHKSIKRFIFTHPDEDHFHGLKYLDDRMDILNFYCVKNKVIKDDETTDFIRYCQLRDSQKVFHLHKGCQRRWMNQSGDGRDGAGLQILWPVTDNEEYQNALRNAEGGGSPNNISIVLQYALQNGVTALWMGDLETEFMESIEDDVQLPKVNILFAPHHGRESGKVPESWLGQLDPDVVIIGEAPAAHLNYYQGYNTITQNSAGDITFICQTGKVHIYVSEPTYFVSFLDDEDFEDDSDYYYIGTLQV